MVFREQLASGKAQIQSGWAEIRRQEKKLEEGAAEIAENEAKVAEAKIEYANGEEEAAQKIAEGEQKIADAEAKVQDIEKPTWYVYDRDTLTEYSGYGENAERLGAIGRVFPVLFFLVAALISLTSMTRMVEEQRTAIGTMKALGYSKMSIAKKYLGYALIATAGGSVLGVLIGEKILPYIIVYAYGILYQAYYTYSGPIPMDLCLDGSGGSNCMYNGSNIFCVLQRTCSTAGSTDAPTGT